MPCESWEPRIVAIERDPLATPFDGKCCKPGVAHARPARVSLDAEAFEDIPVSLTGFHDLTMGLPEKVFTELVP